MVGISHRGVTRTVAGLPLISWQKPLEEEGGPMTQNSVVGSEPVGNVVALEHVNVGIGDQGLALHFYVDGLGFVRDKEYSTGLENMWLNLGPTQFHLPTGMPQVVRGHVGVVVPDQHALVERLEQVGSDFVGTAFGFSEAASFVEVT